VFKLFLPPCYAKVGFFCVAIPPSRQENGRAAVVVPVLLKTSQPVLRSKTIRSMLVAFAAIQSGYLSRWHHDACSWSCV
jgi:hypothetical protein